MMDSQQNEENNLTLLSLVREFAYYVKEIAKRHDSEIAELGKVAHSNSDRILKLELTMLDCSKKIDDKFKELSERSKVGWTVAEKIIAALGFLIMAALTAWSLFKKS
jgi:hypothetical protein